MKQKYIDAHINAAEVYSKLSSAKRLQVGCVVVKDNTIIGIGYNGMPSGWTNDCENVEYVGSDEQIPSPEEMKRLGFTGTDAGWFRTKTKPEVLHAETNALAKIARSTNSSEGASMFVTHAPCLDCAKLIHQSGINSVYYRNTYRSEDGIKFLEKCNINVKKV
jgi:dCMP deaminase